MKFILALALFLMTPNAFSAFNPNYVIAPAAKERIVRATIANNGTCTTTTQSGSWVSSLSHPATGKCAITIAAGIFNAAPSCACSCEQQSNVYYPCVMEPGSVSATAATATCGIAGPAYADQAIEIICMGPRN